jgi:hypothetical protein
MTGPATQVSADGVDALAWHTVTSNPNLSATQRACLSAAYAHADLAQHLTGHMAGTARDGLWYRLAVGFYQTLHGSGAYRHLSDAVLPARCHAEADTVRRWLSGPSPLPGFAELTVAETWGITEDFDWDDPDRDTLMSTLVAQAHNAGVLTAPGHRIELRALAPDADGATEYLVLLHSPSGAVFASAPLAADELAEDGLTGVDAAVAVVTNTARTVDDLLADQRAIAYGPNAAAAPAASARRAFAPLDLTTPASMPAPVSTAAAASRHPRNR